MTVVYHSSTVENPPFDGVFPWPSRSYSSSSCLQSSGSSQNRPDGSSKSEEKKKLDMCSVVYVGIIRQRTGLGPTWNSAASKTLPKWRNRSRMSTRICRCSLVINLENCILGAECSWLYGCRLCRNGRVLLVLPFVCSAPLLYCPCAIEINALGLSHASHVSNVT